MYLYAFRETERGIQERNAAAIAEASARRIAAQRAAWEAEQAEREAARKQREDAVERHLQMQAELRALGIPFHKSFHSIEERAIKLFKTSRFEIRSHRRNREIVFVRQFIAYWAVRLTNLSLPQIGRLMGGYDHTSVLHGRRKYPERRAEMGRHLRQVK